MTAQKKNPQPDGNLIGDAYRGGTLGDTKIVSPPLRKIKEVNMNENRGAPDILARVKARCNEQGITINKLEAISGLSKGSISKWDTFSPTIFSLHKVARELGTTCSDLLGESDPEEREKAQKALVDSIQYLSVRQINLILDLVRESRSL